MGRLASAIAVGARSRRVLALSLVLAVVAAVLVKAATTTDSEPRDTQRLGPLQPASREQAEQSRLLQSLATQLGALEKYQEHGDAYFIISARDSDLFYQSLADTAKQGLPPGVNVEVPPPPPAGFVRMRQSRWSFSGGKIRYESRMLPNEKDGGSGGQEDEHVIRAYDGSRSYDYSLSAKSGTISRGRLPELAVVEESWLTLTTYSQKPISELLSTKGAVYAGRQTVDGVECLEVSIPSESGQIELWISPEHGYRAKRATFSATFRGEYSTYSVTQIDEFRQFGDLWFPTKGRYITSRQSKSGQKDWMTAIDWYVTDVSPEAPDYLFHVQFPLGAKVKDYSDGSPKSYAVGHWPDQDPDSRENPQ